MLVLILGPLTLALGAKFYGELDQLVGPNGIIGLVCLAGAGTVGGFVMKKRMGAARRTEEKRALQAQLDERQREEAARLEALSQRFGAENAERIVNRQLWQGATADMVKEMLGEPEDVSRRVFKTKTTETWKYNRLTARSFGLQVTVENGVVVGWKTP